MRRKRLDRIVAGGLAGCPGLVDVSAAEGSPSSAPLPRVGATSPANGHAVQRPRRNAWVTAAAAFLLVQGALGILYAPVLTGGDLGPFLGVGIVIVGVGVADIAAGIGLLRLHGWARLAAGALAAVSLVFMYAPALAASVSQGAYLGFDWLGIVGFLVVLFAVARRWPADPRR